MNPISIDSFRGLSSPAQYVVKFMLPLFMLATASSCSTSEGDDESMGNQTGSDTNDPTLAQLSKVTTTFPGSDIEGSVNSYVYDQTGRVTSIATQSVREPLGSSLTTELQYDGAILSSVDGIRNSTVYSVLAERIVSRIITNKNSGSTQTTRYTYDEVSRLVQVIDGTFDFTRGCQPGPGAGDGNYSLTWDDSRVVNIISDAGDFTASYTYDEAGLVASRTIDRSCDSSSDVERYIRDESGLLVHIERTSGPDGSIETEERSYDESGRIVGSLLINADNESSEQSRHAYDSLGRLVRWSTVRDDVETIVRTYEYTTGTCVEQIWTEPERSADPEAEVSLIRAPGMTRCAFFGSLP